VERFDDNLPDAKPLLWIASSKAALLEFPRPVRKRAGYALYLAQVGLKSIKAKPLRSFGGAGVLEIVEDHDGSTYRAVYTVKFAGAVYVLHAFQKKSKKGIATPRGEVEIVERRLKLAAEHYWEFRHEQERDSSK